jgi:streptomycin 6-kinase
MNTDSYKSLWALSNLTPIAKTITSNLYKADRDDTIVVLKVLTPLGMSDEAPGALFLEWLDGDGAVRILRHDAGAHLLEYLPGPTLKSRPDREAATVMADLIGRMHTPRDRPAPELAPLQERFAALYDRAGESELFSKAAELAEHLIATQTRSIPLHGDMHHDNVMLSPRGWLSLDPKGLIGDPHYETANIFGNPHGRPDLVLSPSRQRTMADIFAARLGLDATRVLQFAAAHAALSVCWNIMDGLDPSHSLAVAESLMAMAAPPREPNPSGSSRRMLGM